jgi:hypothetical protein
MCSYPTNGKVILRTIYKIQNQGFNEGRRSADQDKALQQRL